MTEGLKRDASASWYHDKPKEHQEAFIFKNFIGYLESLGKSVTDPRAGTNPPDFLCTIDGEQWEIEVTIADGRVAQVFPHHVTRLRAGVSSVATTSEWWAGDVPNEGPFAHDAYASARDDLKGEIAKRVLEKCSPRYVDQSFTNPSRTYVVIDASLFPFATAPESDTYAAGVRAHVTVPDDRLGGVYFCLAIAPKWDRRHYGLAR